MNPGVESFLKLVKWETRIADFFSPKKGRALRKGIIGVMNIQTIEQDSGGYQFQFNDGDLAIKKGLSDQANATFQIKPNDLFAILAEDITAETVFMTGKYRLEGEGSYIIVLATILQMALRAKNSSGISGKITKILFQRILKRGGYQKNGAS